MDKVTHDNQTPVTLSFLVLGYKEPNHVRLCIQNILDLELDIPYEILYVDNKGDCGIPEMVEELFPQVRIFKNDDNLGHPSGNNVGLKAANGRYTLMMNPDIVLRSADEVKKLVQYMDDNEDIAFLGPKLHNPDGTVQNSCYRPYTKLTPIYRRTFLGKLPKGRADINNYLMTDFDHNSTIEVEWLLGACMFIRREAMEQIGVMDESFFLYFGDYEWCDRARAAGWKVIYYHDVEHVYHYHKRESATSRFTVPQLFSYVTRIHIKDWLQYLRKQKQK